LSKNPSWIVYSLKTCWKEKANYRVEIFCVHVMWNIFVVKVKLFRRDVNRILIGDMKKQLYIYKAPMLGAPTSRDNIRLRLVRQGRFTFQLISFVNFWVVFKEL
jgi:hypothetical protein